MNAFDVQLCLSGSPNARSRAGVPLACPVTVVINEILWLRTCEIRHWGAAPYTTGVHGDDRDTEEKGNKGGTILIPTHNGLITMRLTHWANSSRQSG
ncbi:hypothetical protein ALC60_13106 [Trachymyrmex zeteki]|uniref:Uncharacterized protein n=1 Tax=Mycetomoellerius zeteki TaxID=64791 RepID=A0A151WJ57_9HYME|nr:hypothetical protein ALC60_13106 [Trachymyrmex zeteki]